MIAIKHFDMPNSCNNCCFQHQNKCQITGALLDNACVERHKDCPLVEINLEGMKYDPEYSDAYESGYNFAITEMQRIMSK